MLLVLFASIPTTLHAGDHPLSIGFEQSGGNGYDDTFALGIHKLPGIFSDNGFSRLLISPNPRTHYIDDHPLFWITLGADAFEMYPDLMVGLSYGLEDELRSRLRTRFELTMVVRYGEWKRFYQNLLDSEDLVTDNGVDALYSARLTYRVGLRTIGGLDFSFISGLVGDLASSGRLGFEDPTFFPFFGVAAQYTFAESKPK